MSPGRATVGADLGGSSKHSNENFKGRRGESLPTLETAQLEVGSNGWKSTARCMVSGAPQTTLENPEDRVPFTPSRTHNWIRAGHGGFNPEPIGCRWIARAASVERVDHRVPTGG
ncbi:atp synthase subunit beta [Cucumis melo var. makuwa]|uniref:Atp synthase subunit beta n=1 Tax=Cucumis melo var. makuwa TaxID=1194695 RepID=A0A5D3D3R5_CUCMM|nr:atp synthase subunit beta [Cucumis melo var. makuwa]TYK18036.1 atp synthase subunit beta [Cucumis melo var. makuwa]